MHERRLVDEPDGVVVTAELDQAGDYVQTVRELVLLRPQRVGQRADVVELAQQRLELRPVAERDDCAHVASPHGDRHPVRDEHAVVDEHDLIRPGHLAAEHVADMPFGTR